MGVFTFTEENTSPIPPAKLFKALVEDGDNIIPKVVDDIQSIENVEGHGGPGTIKKITFVHDGKVHTGKHKIDVVDKDNFVYDYTVHDNGIFPDAAEKITIHTKLSPAPSGGSISKVTVNYVTKGDSKPSEEHLKEGKEKAHALFKAVEAYLVANPNYN